MLRPTAAKSAQVYSQPRCPDPRTQKKRCQAVLGSCRTPKLVVNKNSPIQNTTDQQTLTKRSSYRSRSPLSPQAARRSRPVQSTIRAGLITNAPQRTCLRTTTAWPSVVVNSNSIIINSVTCPRCHYSFRRHCVWTYVPSVPRISKKGAWLISKRLSWEKDRSVVRVHRLSKSMIIRSSSWRSSQTNRQ